MKFTALRTDKVAIDGIQIHQFAEGEDYDFPEPFLTRLRELGIAPSEPQQGTTTVPADDTAEPDAAAKDTDPATENKAVNPVAETKPTAPAKGKKAK